MNNDALTGIMDHFESLTNDLTAIRAIVDCGSVLAALERSPMQEPPGGGLVTGESFANGHQVRDASLPDMLKHALDLLDMACNEADLMQEIAKNALVGKGGAA